MTAPQLWLIFEMVRKQGFCCILFPRTNLFRSSVVYSSSFFTSISFPILVAFFGNLPLPLLVVFLWTLSHPILVVFLSTSLSCLSSDMHTFCISFLETKSFGQISFSFTCPAQWNSLPYEICLSDSAPAFRSALMTHLFQSAHNIWVYPLFPANLLGFLHILWWYWWCVFSLPCVCYEFNKIMCASMWFLYEFCVNFQGIYGIKLHMFLIFDVLPVDLYVYFCFCFVTR